MACEEHVCVCGMLQNVGTRGLHCTLMRTVRFFVFLSVYGSVHACFLVILWARPTGDFSTVGSGSADCVRTPTRFSQPFSSFCLRFQDGTHRFAFFRDQGVPCFPLVIPVEQEDLFLSLFSPDRLVESPASQGGWSSFSILTKKKVQNLVSTFCAPRCPFRTHLLTVPGDL